MDDESCATRLPQSPPQGHSHGGLRDDRMRRQTGARQYGVRPMGRKGNRKLTVKNDIVMTVMMVSMMRLMMGMVILTKMADLWAKELMLMLWADDRPAWDCYPRLASHMTGRTLCSPMQPNRRNFTALQIPTPFPTNSQRSAPGTAPWEGECHVRATVQWCHCTMV